MRYDTLTCSCICATELSCEMKLTLYYAQADYVWDAQAENMWDNRVSINAR